MAIIVLLIVFIVLIRIDDDDINAKCAIGKYANASTSQSQRNTC